MIRVKNAERFNTACHAFALKPKSKDLFKHAACGFKTYVLRFKTYVSPRPMSRFDNETERFYGLEWYVLLAH